MTIWSGYQNPRLLIYLSFSILQFSSWYWILCSFPVARFNEYLTIWNICSFQQNSPWFQKRMQKPFQSLIREIWNLYGSSVNFITSKSILTSPFVYTIICNPAEKFHSFYRKLNQAGQSVGVRSHWKTLLKGFFKPF